MSESDPGVGTTSGAPPWDRLGSVAARLPWLDLRQAFSDAVESGLRPWLDSGQPYLSEQLLFALGRFEAGAALLGYFECDNDRLLPKPRSILDVGTGNGGVAMAFANCPDYRVAAMDIGQNRVLRQVARATGLGLRYALASGHDLPYAAESFDIVLLLDTIEHVSTPRRLGAEIMRVLRPGGVCFVSTPARLRYVLAPDPHYGVHGIVGLPNFLQRFAVDRIARRRITSPDGTSSPAYDVEHLYWRAREVGRVFPGPKTIEVLFARPMSGGPPLSVEWWRRKLQDFLFDHILVYKGGRP